jgi:hypothetical protein
LFKEEFLWEKRRNNIKDIKEFSLNILVENVELNKKVNLSYEFLERIYINNLINYRFILILLYQIY